MKLMKAATSVMAAWRHRRERKSAISKINVALIMAIVINHFCKWRRRRNGENGESWLRRNRAMSKKAKKIVTKSIGGYKHRCCARVLSTSGGAANIMAPSRAWHNGGARLSRSAAISARNGICSICAVAHRSTSSISAPRTPPPQTYLYLARTATPLASHYLHKHRKRCAFCARL
jgi:hypothetical protein